MTTGGSKTYTMINGPYAQNAQNIREIALSKCHVRFINTAAMLNKAGLLSWGLFY